MHPRRGADLASSLSDETPLFPLGSASARALGTSNAGFADDIAGLRSILDPNVPTNVGAGANEDRIVAVRLEDLILLEQLLLTDVDIAVANVGVLGAHGTVNLTQGFTQALRGPRWTDETRMESEADARTRTGDPFITSEVLYQLSYVGSRPTLAA
jgi:hypothetical protein